MPKKRNCSSDSSSSSASSSSSDEEEVPETKKRGNKVISQKVIDSSDSSSSSSEDDEWNSKPKAKAKGRGGGRGGKKPAPKATNKRKKIEEKEEGEVEDNDDEDDDQEESEFNDGWDENLMGDEEDRERLSKMTEKEREVELFNRSEKREAAKFRFQIQKKLEDKKKKLKLGDQSTTTATTSAKKVKITDKPEKDKTAEVVAALTDSTTRSVERRRNMENKRNMKDAIKGLKAEREKKKLKLKLRAADVYSDSSDSDSGGDSDNAKPSKKATKASSSSDDSSSSISDDDSDSDRVRTGTRSGGDSRKRNDDNDWDGDKDRASDAEQDGEQFYFTLEHLNSIRLSRFKMEKWCHAPFFKDTITGCFVRIGVGSQYLVGQILEVVETSKVYMLGKTRTNKGIKLKNSKRPDLVYRLEYISNSEFLQEEYEKWCAKMVTDRCEFPTRDFVERKKAAIQDALNHQFSDADVELIVAEKGKFKDKPVNFAMKKSQLMKERDFAESSGDHDKAIELGREIDRLEDEAKRRDKIRTSNIAAISFINERNRMRNIKEAERAIAEAAKEAQNIKDDPFTRRKCAPTMISIFNKATNKTSETGDQQLEESKESGSPEQALATTVAAAMKDSTANNKATVSLPVPIAPAMAANANNGNGNNNNNNNSNNNNNGKSGADSDDLFSAHNFDIKIDFDLFANSSSTASANSLSSNFLSSLPNGKASNGFGVGARPSPIVNASANRRMLNLDEYKKKKGLI